MTKLLTNALLLATLSCAGCGNDGGSSAADEIDQSYMEQLKRYDGQLDKSDEQDRRLDALLTKWEEQAARQDRILAEQEKRLGLPQAK